MAVQILNDMPDAKVHRGEPFAASLRELNAPRALRPQLSGRAVFLGITIALHVVFALVFMHAIDLGGRQHRARADDAVAVRTRQ